MKPGTRRRLSPTRRHEFGAFAILTLLGLIVMSIAALVASRAAGRAEAGTQTAPVHEPFKGFYCMAEVRVVDQMPTTANAAN